MSDAERVLVAMPPVVAGTEPEVVARAVAALRRGQIVGIPTDTVYGLAAAINRPSALARLYTLKGRPLDKAIPVLLSGSDDIRLVAAEVSDEAHFLVSRFWPGALTLVVPARAELPGEVVAMSEDHAPTVAVRVPAHPLTRAIIAAAGGALAVTSANRSGETPCLTAAAVAELGAASPDLVIDGGPAPLGSPSTIVALSDGEVVMLRTGAISEERISAALDLPRASSERRG